MCMLCCTLIWRAQRMSFIKWRWKKFSIQSPTNKVLQWALFMKHSPSPRITRFPLLRFPLTWILDNVALVGEFSISWNISTVSLTQILRNMVFSRNQNVRNAGNRCNLKCALVVCGWVTNLRTHTCRSLCSIMCGNVCVKVQKCKISNNYAHSHT